MHQRHRNPIGLPYPSPRPMPPLTHHIASRGWGLAAGDNVNTANAEATLPHSKPMRHEQPRLEPAFPSACDLTARTARSLVPYILAQV